MFDKLFGWGKRKDEPKSKDPEILFGRYSDNNKSVAKVARWTDADNLFKEKKIPESIDAFFDYLRDDNAQNVVYERNEAQGRFEFYQGSKIVRGTFDDSRLQAEVTLAGMPQASVPVMRRLLEMNFSLYYSRFALDNERLCMRFDSNIASASPSKLYYGLKELSTKADKQDDLLVQDFSMLQSIDSEHIQPLPTHEKEVKYQYMQKWIQEVLDAIAATDADKFSGGNAYLLLSLAYRIDFLVSPEGQLLNELEKISAIYFKKDERQPTEKNRDMIEAFRKLQAKTKEEIFPYLFRSKYTFAIVAPQVHKTLADSIHASNQSMTWYRDNNYPFYGNGIIEYGLSYAQYSYSLPRPITEFFLLYMRINYPDFFLALGFTGVYYDVAKNEFNMALINDQIYAIQERWREKYPAMDFKAANLRQDSLINFNHSFTNEIEFLNMESQ